MGNIMKNKLLLATIIFLNCIGSEICPMDHKRPSGDDFDQQDNNKRRRIVSEELSAPTVHSSDQTSSSVPSPATNTENTKKNALSILEQIKKKHAKRQAVFIQSLATESKTSSACKKMDKKPTEKISASTTSTKSSVSKTAHENQKKPTDVTLLSAPKPASSSMQKKSAEFTVPSLPVDHTKKVAEKKQLRIAKLHEAIRENKLNTVKKIVSAGVDIEAPTPHGSTPLMIATSHDAREIVEYLIKMNAKIDATNKQGLNSLHLAAIKNNSYILVLLLGGNQAGKPNINSVSMNGLTPLMVAAFFGSATAFDVLLTYGADITMRSHYGETALDIVSRKLHELGQYKPHENRFVTAKRDQYISIKNKLLHYNQGIFTKEQAQEELPSWRSTQEINAFYRIYGGFDAIGQLQRAVKAGDIAEIKRILKKNPQLINTQNRNGETALHYAAMNGYVFITKLLLQHGADRSVKNRSNQTALDIVNNKLRYVTEAQPRETLGHRLLEISALLDQDIAFAEPSTQVATMQRGTPSSSSSNSALNQSAHKGQTTDIWSIGVKLLEKASPNLAATNSAAVTQMAMQTAAMRMAIEQSSAKKQIATVVAKAMTTATQLNMQASLPNKPVINPLWIAFVEEVINECIRILTQYKITASPQVLAVMKNQLFDLYSSLKSFTNCESFINKIMSILRNNVMPFVSNKHSVDFAIELDTALQELIQRDDITAKLQALALLSFKIKAAAEFFGLKHNPFDDQDGAAGATVLPKKFVEKMEHVFSKTKQPEASWWNTLSIKNIGTQALLSLGTHVVLGKIRHGMSLKSLTTAAA